MRCRCVVVFALAIGLWLSPGVMAACEPLPAEILTATQLSGSQEDRVESFVSAQFERLRSDDAREVEDGRRCLESPFVGTENPSIGFRLVYGRLVSVEVRDLLRGQDVREAVNGLLVAGLCGAPQAVDRLEEALDHPSGSVRGAAVAGLHTVIREAQDDRVRRDLGERAVDLVAGAMGETDDPIFATACEVALASTEGAALHGPAARAISGAVPELVGTLVDQAALADALRWERVVQLSLRLVYVDVINAVGRMPRDAAMDAVEAGASGLALVKARVLGGGIDVIAESEEERAALLDLAAQSERLALAAGRALPNAQTGQERVRAALEEAFDRGDDGVFLDALDRTVEWIERTTGQDVSGLGL